MVCVNFPFRTKPNNRTGRMRRSSQMSVAMESSGIGPLETTANKCPTQSVVIKNLPLRTPAQVHFATWFAVAM